MVKKVLVLINPVSGVGKQKDIAKFFKLHIDKEKIRIDIKYTGYAGHARELARSAVGRYDIVTAVGGDGTVNEVGSELVGTDTALAIIPTGSGNGLARYLKISMRPERAVKQLNDHVIKKIDTIKINEFRSLNVSGIGFDAHISHLFAKMKQRGLISYIKLVVREFGDYKACKYNLMIDGKKLSQKAYLISFANSSQYGNNFYISPDAKIDDGYIDVCVMNKFPKIAAPVLLISKMNKENVGGYLEKIVRAKNVEIEHPKALLGHIDGEPVFLGKKVSVSIDPLSLNVVVPG
jgi:YegS/Rv2252/BmrU family lipid kinase